MAKSMVHQKYEQLYCHYITVYFQQLELFNYRRTNPPESGDEISSGGRLFNISVITYRRSKNGKTYWDVSVEPQENTP